MPNNNEQIVVKPSKWKSFKDTYFLTGSIDIPFLGLTIALLTIGLIMLFSASYPYAYYYKDSSYYYFIRQIVFAVAGLDPAHRAGAVYLPLAELSLEFVVPDISPGDDTFLAADMRSPLISCK